MKEHSWETQIDSDIGPLTLEVTYEIEPGQHGDYYTETIHPSVTITEISVQITGSDYLLSDMVAELEREIEDDLADDGSQ
tara:strand:+ start:450 stop:689 length:240 start_codon:yes stop_codon:yes gene_type:complete